MLREEVVLDAEARGYTATKPGGVAKPKTDTRPDDPMDVGGFHHRGGKAKGKGKDNKDKGASKGKGATPKTDKACFNGGGKPAAGKGSSKGAGGAGKGKGKGKSKDADALEAETTGNEIPVTTKVEGKQSRTYKIAMGKLVEGQ
eukprot:861203-Amphidinium_carterae.1